MRKNKIWIGIDNGVTGSIGFVDSIGNRNFCQTPTFSTFNYQKAGKKITRIDSKELESTIELGCEYDRSLVLIERPMVNPKRFQATCSAMRALEATLITIEYLQLPFQYIDSKAWQKAMLPNVKGARYLKQASLETGLRLFPSLKKTIEKQKDADGLLIAEWARRENL